MVALSIDDLNQLIRDNLNAALVTALNRRAETCGEPGPLDGRGSPGPPGARGDRDNVGPPELPEPEEEPGPTGPEGAGESGYNGGWKINDIGYFQLDKTDSKSLVINKGTKVFYKDVFIFVNYIKDVIKYKGEDLIKSNIYAYLRGTALE